MQSSDVDTCLSHLYVPLLAAKASWFGMRAGFPFGGVLGWLLVIISSNDNGEYPWAPYLLAVLGWPIVLVCDIILFVPALVVRASTIALK